MSYSDLCVQKNDGLFMDEQPVRSVETAALISVQWPAKSLMKKTWAVSERLPKSKRTGRITSDVSGL